MHSSTNCIGYKISKNPIGFFSSFTDKVACLNDLGPDQIVEAVVRCLWRCSSSVAEHPISSYRLPNNPIEKFRFASKISAEIQVRIS